jgi:cytochrome c
MRHIRTTANSVGAGRLQDVQSDPEAATGALATRPPTETLSATQTLTGGAGLFDHSARDPFAPSAGLFAGGSALILTIGIAALLVIMNPAFVSGKAGGTANQLGQVAEGAQLAPGTPAFEGAQILATKACVGCHVIPGIPGATGTVGPSLAGLATRTRIAGGAVTISGPDDLKTWIMNPASLKPGTPMPNVGLTDDEATKIVAYLETLK